VTVADILDEVVVRSLPTSLVFEKPLLYVTLWRDVRESVQPQLEIDFSGATTSFPAPTIRPGNEKILYQIRLGDLNIAEPGRYDFRLTVNSKTLHKLRLDVKEVPGVLLSA
jgi:hypothetical protein